MANIVYGHTTENYAATYAAAVKTGSADANYPVANLADFNPVKPHKLSASGNGAWEWNLGSAKSVGFFAIINHNLLAGQTITIKSHTATVADWFTTGTTVATRTIPALYGDGHTQNVWLDTSAGTARQYWGMTINGSGDSSPISLGEVWLASTKRQFPININWGVQFTFQHDIIEHKTDYGVSLIYDYGATRRLMQASMETTDAGWTQYEAWWRDARGRATPVIVVPDPDLSDVWMARFTSNDLVSKYTFLNDHEVTVALEELSLGVAVRG